MGVFHPNDGSSKRDDRVDPVVGEANDVTVWSKRDEIVIRSPVDGEMLGSVAPSSAEEVDREVAAALVEFATDWPRNSRRRQTALSAWADALEAEAEDVADLLVRETGKVIGEARFEVTAAVDALRYNAGAARQLLGEAGPLPDGSAGHVERVPVGVTAFIVPWNWPVLLLLRDLAPALAAGVTAVVKPAPQTPLASKRVIEIGRAAGMPAGTVRLVYGGAESGHALVEHDDVRAIAFTGSSATGSAILRAAADGVKRVLLELGGKGTSVIFADADLEAAVDAAVAGAFVTAGQMCMACTRVVVERSVHDRVVEAMVERTRALRVGDPFDPDTDLGPLVSEDHLERVLSYLEIAQRDGRVECGGERTTDDGPYLSPSVVTGIPPESPVVSEEIFGPVVTVEPFDSEAEALNLVNGTPYGLIASIWTRDAGRAWRTARAIEAGTVWINRFNRSFPEVPSGGFKRSGLGRTRGLDGLRQFTEPKHINWEVPN